MATLQQADFGVNLLRQLTAEKPDCNVFFSPTSIALALGMTLYGAAGATRNAIAAVLGIQQGDQDAADRLFASLQRAVGAPGDGVQLKIANSIWARSGAGFQPEFLQRTREIFNANVTELDFSGRDAIATVNGWVAQQTNGLITKIIDQFSTELVLLIVNAVYFKGIWKNPFDPQLTTARTFHLADGSTIDVPMMTSGGSYRFLNGEGFQALALPYGAGGRLSMYIFVPIQLAAFLRQLNGQALEGWIAQCESGSAIVGLPRFRIAYDVGLQEALSALGMAIAFDAARADFSPMFSASTHSYISSVRHKSVIEVNEEGTEAAAATSVDIELTSMPPLIVVDRPFVVAIRDDENGNLLFLGAINDPRASDGP